LPLLSRLTTLVAFACLASACATHEGTYTPDCIAYAGNRIELGGGRFVWDKFTDQVIVDDAGEKVDPFPEYPVRGRYRIEEHRVIFDSYTGEELPDMYLQSDRNRHYLFTAEEFETWRESGTRPDCPLILGDESQ
jgi:hypothetical protein